PVRKAEVRIFEKTSPSRPKQGFIRMLRKDKRLGSPVSLDASTKLRFRRVRQQSFCDVGLTSGRAQTCFVNAEPGYQKRNDAERNECDIGRHSQPFDKVHHGRFHKQAASGMPVAVVKNIEQLQNTAGKEIQNNHQQEADIQTPKRNTDVLFSTSPDFIS